MRGERVAELWGLEGGHCGMLFSVNRIFLGIKVERKIIFNFLQYTYIFEVMFFQFYIQYNRGIEIANHLTISFARKIDHLKLSARSLLSRIPPDNFVQYHLSNR